MRIFLLGLLLTSACGTSEAPAAKKSPEKAPAPAQAKATSEPAKTAAETAPAAVPAVGDAATPFSLPDDAGREVTLDQFRDQRAVLLAFYPKDFTGG